MKPLYLILSLIFISSSTLAQNYELGLIHNSGYNFKIVAIPDFDSSGNTDISDIGFTLMLPAGLDDVVNPITFLPARIWNVTEFDAAFLTGQGLGDGTLDAFQFNMPAGQSLVAHTTGQMIDLVSFDVSNTPISGDMSFLLNSDPIAMGASGVLDSFYNSDIDGTGTQDYFSGIAPGLESFMFDTLTVNEFEFLENSIKIYPNPASEYINVTASFEIGTIELFNMLGKSVLSINNSAQLNVKNLASGVYFIKVYHNGSVMSKKLVIDR